MTGCRESKAGSRRYIVRHPDASFLNLKIAKFTLNSEQGINTTNLLSSALVH
jgi:hypothetical protein